MLLRTRFPALSHHVRRAESRWTNMGEGEAAMGTQATQPPRWCGNGESNALMLPLLDRKHICWTISGWLVLYKLGAVQATLY